MLETPEVREVDPQTTAVIVFTAKPHEFGKQFSVVLPEVSKQISESGGAATGPPFARYLEHDGIQFVIEAGLPVDKPITPGGRVKGGHLPGGKAVVVWYTGPYDKLGEAHDEIMAWMKENDLDGPEGPWEIYWTDPMEEPDRSKWRTEIIYPLS